MTQLTIKQAVNYTGKSENTLRRLLKKYSKTTHEYSKFFHKKSGKYYIDKDFLKRHYDVAEGEKEESQQTALDLSIVTHLKEQNTELNARVKELTHVVAHQSQQLANKDEQIRLLSAPKEDTKKGQEVMKTFLPLLIGIGVLLGLLIAVVMKSF